MLRSIFFTGIGGLIIIISISPANYLVVVYTKNYKSCTYLLLFCEKLAISHTTLGASCLPLCCSSHG
jgi:hypothetical protein